MMHSRLRACGRSFLAALVATASLAALVVVGQSPATADPVMSVKGEACSYMVEVGLFGGPQVVNGCGGNTSRTGGGATTSGSTTVTGSGAVTPFTAADVGAAITGVRFGTSFIPPGTTIVSVTNSTTVVISAAATGSASFGLTLTVSYPHRTTDTGYSPHVALPGDGSGGSMSASDSDGAKAQYGPAVIHGGQWPCEEPGTDPNGDGYSGNCASQTPPSGPQAASTSGDPGSGTVTASADISSFTTPNPVGCYPGYGPTCVTWGGFGPFPVEGESLHAECTATGASVTGSTTFVNATHTFSTDGDGNPVAWEPVPDNPPPNYTRHGVITNVGDVFTAVYNEHIYNSDGSLTVNAVHMYLFGPVAVGEVIRGQVTCGTTPAPAAPADTLAPSCGTPVVAPVGPEDPTPKSPREELVGTFDTSGVQSVTNIEVTNGTVQVGINPGSSFDYLKFVPGQTGPLTVLATRTPEAETARLPMHWSFDVTDVAGNTSHCEGFEGPPVANDDAYTAYKNTPLTTPASGVLANDGDGNDDPLTAGSASDPANGSVTLNPNGSFTYTPDAGFSGTDTFTYVADDGRGLTDSATVTITVEAIVAPTELRITDGVPPEQPWGGPVAEGGDGETSAFTFTVTRSGSTAAASTVKYKTSGGTATANTDYTAVALQTLTFAVGETSKTVTVDVLGDGLSEKDETFNLVLSAPTNAYITDTIGVGTIVNDDGGLPSFAVDIPYVDPPSVDEGDEGSTLATFTISRNGNANGSSTVKYKTSGGTATAGTDYTAVPLTTVTFAPGEYSKTVDVSVTGDLTAENNETFNLVLSAPVGGVIGDAAGTATIIDNEGPVTPGPATFMYVDDFGGGGGPEWMGSNFFIIRTGDTSGTSTVKYKVSGGTATAGTDYTANDWGPALTGTLTFGPDESFLVLDFPTIDDNLAEKNETYNLVLSAPTGGVIADGTGLHTIVNDDGSTQLSVNDPYLAEGDSGTAPATFTITRSGNTNAGTTVKYVTKNAPSAEADDFTAVPLQTLTFAPGETTKTVTVDVIGDAAVEYNERFTLALSAPVGATFQDAAGTALIVNDD